MTDGAEIPMHCGFFKGVLRVHFTLLTDADDTSNQQRYIEVGGQQYSWKTGEMVAFDDTYPHRVVNHVKGRRVVLFLDIERPYADPVSRVLAKAMTFLLKSSPNVTRVAAAQELRKH
jgi:aspartyl/asparaginyl beta-hydroxylase (cupin superfamily)